MCIVVSILRRARLALEDVRSRDGWGTKMRTAGEMVKGLEDVVGVLERTGKGSA